MFVCCLIKVFLFARRHSLSKSVNDLDHDAVSLVLVLIVPERLARASQKSTFEHEGSETLKLIIRGDGPPVIRPVARALCASVPGPPGLARGEALVEFALVGQPIDVFGVVFGEDGLDPERGD